MKSTLMTLTLIATLALGTSSSAQDATKSKDIEELRREVRALEERLRVLSAAATEVAELTMRSAAVWSRALGPDAKVDEPNVVSKTKASAAPAPRSPRPLQKHHVKEFSLREFRALLRPFGEAEWFGQLRMGRGRAALFEGKELAKRLLRAFVPVKRLRPAARRGIDDLPPDARYAVEPLGRLTAAIFVAELTFRA